MATPAGGALEQTTPEMVPIPGPDIVPLLRAQDDQVLLVDAVRRSVHTVNTTGGMIWAQCDGTQTVTAIIAALAQMFTIAPETIAADVTRSITDLRNFGLVRTDGDPPFPSLPAVELRPGPDGSRYVIPSPCSCGIDLEALAWAGSFAVASGPVRMGIRYNTDMAGALARDAVREHIIDDPDAPITYTLVLLGDEPSDERLTRSALYEGRRYQVGPEDHDGLLIQLRQRVESWRPLCTSEIRLSAIGIDGPEGVALVPAFYGIDSQLIEQAHKTEGRFVASPVFVDATTVTVDGRPLRGIVWPEAETRRLDADEALRRLVTVAELRGDDDLEDAVDALDALAGKVNAIVTPADQAADVARALVRPR